MTIPNRQDEINDFVREFFTKTEPSDNGTDRREHVPSTLSDDEVIELCRKAKNAPKFASLFDGGDRDAHDGADRSPSGADYALIGMLKFYTQDPDQIEKLMRRSALWRSRWDEKHTGGTWLRYSINRALGKKIEDTYQPHDGAELLVAATVTVIVTLILVVTMTVRKRSPPARRL